jgi:hypothetical protein
MESVPYGNLDPVRFPSMSLRMVVRLGFLLEREYATPPRAVHLPVRPDALHGEGEWP